MRKVTKIAPVLASIAQLAGKQLLAKESDLQEVLRLLNQFRDDVENDFRAKEKAERASQSEFIETRTTTEDFIGRLESNQKDLEDEQAELKTCINN